MCLSLFTNMDEVDRTNPKTSQLCSSTCLKFVSPEVSSQLHYCSYILALLLFTLERGSSSYPVAHLQLPSLFIFNKIRHVFGLLPWPPPCRTDKPIPSRHHGPPKKQKKETHYATAFHKFEICAIEQIYQLICNNAEGYY